MQSTIRVRIGSRHRGGRSQFWLLGTLHHLSTVASTVPANGDVNPYGVAVVPATTGTLVANSVLVSNFNNVGNLQGTGTTIMQVSCSTNPWVSPLRPTGTL